MRQGLVVLVSSLLLLAAGFDLAGCSKKPSSESITAPPGLVERPSGLKVQEVAPGQGEVAAKGKIVAIHYTGYLPDGAKFDTTLNRLPLQFQLGRGEVLKGWDEGVEGMKVGEKRKLVVPPQLAFGDRTVGEIKPGTTLTFDVELVSVK